MNRILAVSLLVAGLFLVPVVNIAAATSSADQQGTWEGTLASTSYTYMTGEAQSAKVAVRLVIHPDDTYELSRGEGVLVISSGVGTFGPTNGFLRGTVAGVTFATGLHFKNGKLKGQMTLGLNDPAGAFAEGKLSLKKQPI